MNIWQRIKSKTKRAVTPMLSAVLALAVVVGSISPFPLIKAIANSPAFNGHPNDEPTIQVRKNGAGAAWSNTTSLAAGDTAQVMLYVHNYVPDTVAKNTRVKAVVPAGVNKSHTIDGLVWADNGVDQSTQKKVTINTGTTDTELRINYNSVRHYINQNGVYVEQPITNGQDVFSETGLNLGDINGCWPYLRAITFTATVYKRADSAISTYKEVAIASVNDSWSRDRVTTTPGNVVDYHVYVENTGSAGAYFDTVWVTDTLDSKLTYKPGSSWMVTKDDAGNDIRQDFLDSQLHFDGQTISWRVDNMPARPDAAFHLYFQATLAANSVFAVGTTTVPNTARIMGIEPSGQKIKNTNTVYVDVKKDPAPVIDFDIEKDIRNLTTNSQINNDTPVAASPGDLVQYTLHIVNTGNQTVDALVRDAMPQNVTIEGDVMQKSISQPESAYLKIDPQGLFTTDKYLRLVKVAPGNINGIDIRFKARINNSGLPAGNIQLTNIGRVYSDAHGLEDADNAYVTIAVNTDFILNKYVQDPVSGEWTKASSAVVKEGARLKYRIDVINAGNTSLLVNNIRDVLPQYVRYIDNTLVIDPHISPTPITSDDAFFADGLTNYQLLPGITKRYEFEVEVVKCPVLGDTSLVNAAYVRANGSSNEVIGTATINLRVSAPTSNGL